MACGAGIDHRHQLFLFCETARPNWVLRRPRCPIPNVHILLAELDIFSMNGGI